MKIFQGGKGSSFDKDGNQRFIKRCPQINLSINVFSDGIPKEYLLQVKGSSHLNCKAIQETLSASSLNTNDCFVLVSGGMSYVWFGKVFKVLCKT